MSADDELVERLGNDGPFHTHKNRRLRLDAAAAITRLTAALTAERERCAKVAAFAKDVLAEFWSQDTADAQEYGLKHGLLVEVDYDPEKHGEVEDSEPGDQIYVYSDWFKDASRALPPTEEG